MLNLCPPQQTGFTNSLNCSVAQPKSPAGSESKISCRISPKFKGTAYRNGSLTLHQGRFHVRHPYLSCRCVKQCRVLLGANPRGWKVRLRNEAPLTSPLGTTGCKMPCSNLPALSWAPCREYPAPPLSSLPDPDSGQGTWCWPCESRGSEEAEPSHLG